MELKLGTPSEATLQGPDALGSDQAFSHSLIAPATMPSVMTLPSHISAIQVNRFQRDWAGSLFINDSRHGLLSRGIPSKTKPYRRGSEAP